jgi:hypothetical protein
LIGSLVLQLKQDDSYSGGSLNVNGGGTTVLLAALRIPI